MENTINPNALAEVLEYLKGIEQEDIEKIPKKLLDYFKENASKEYKCNFDYRKPLNQLELLNETRGLISMICYNYWCENEEQRKRYVKRISDNEKVYQRELSLKYNNNLFANNVKDKTNSNNLSLIETKKIGIIKKIINKIKNVLKLT